MALTPTEHKKIEKIEQLIAEKQKERETLKAKCARDFASYAMKFNLWRLDKKTVETELKALAKKYKIT